MRIARKGLIVLFVLAGIVTTMPLPGTAAESLDGHLGGSTASFAAEYGKATKNRERTRMPSKDLDLSPPHS